MKRFSVALLALAVLVPGVSGCGGSSSGQKTLTVLAASSLTETFDQLEKSFESQHPDVDVKIVYDSSATLAEMAEQGAPGDVLATADKPTMDGAVAKDGTSGTPVQFASNVLQVAVPKANPAGITAFADLDKAGVKYVVCVPSAPCGATAKRLLAQDQISRKPVSEEVDVKSVLAKVTANDADAGLVYRTDVKAAGDQVTGLDIPGAADAPNTYWVAVTKQAKESALAKDWIALMQSSKGQQVFRAAAFGAPTS